MLKKVEIFRILRLPFPPWATIDFQNLRMPFLFSKKFPSHCLALSMPVMLLSSVCADESNQASSLAQRELERREAAVQEAQMLLLKGDEAYNAGKYEEAIEAFAGARETLPDSPTTAELRSAATQRYAQASVELGKELSRKGDVQGAKGVVDRALVEEDAADDPETKGYRAQLDDPIRTNPALTKEHAAEVDAVRRLLYTAQGAFDLGKYDEARRSHMEILRIDPYNKAARRGLEQIAAKKSVYYGSAFDQTRAELLSQVDAEWELPLSPDLVLPDLPTIGDDFTRGGFVPVSNKLKRIIIPKFQIADGMLMDAIDLLRLRILENDNFSLDPADKGINITFNLGDPTMSPAKEILAKRFDLQVANVPAEKILKYIADITGTTFRTDDYAVTISPIGASSDALTSRTYRVPPDFLSNLSPGDAGDDGEAGDIFNTEPNERGLLARRRSAQELFSMQGVQFPGGASATFNPASNTLRIVNTEGNHDIIQQIIDNIAQTEPVSVAVRVTMLKVEKNILEELSFDWMLNNFQFGADSWIPGASELNLSGGTTGNGSALTDLVQPPGTIFPTNPITAGNRSGDGAIAGETINSLLQAGSSRGSQAMERAPGVFGMNGIIGGATVQALMRGLDQKKGVDLMAQPSVTTRSGQAASIYVVDEFIYPTEYEPPELPNSVSGTTTIFINDDGTLAGAETAAASFPVTPATPTAFEKRDVGIILEVLPVADANRRYIDVTLNPSITDFDGFVNYGSPINTTSQGAAGPVTKVLTENAILMPVFSVRRANTNLVVADGATIVIGGLLTDEVIHVNDKTPILGDIPLLGRLFQSNAKKHTSMAILFLVNVELLDPTGRPYRDR